MSAKPWVGGRSQSRNGQLSMLVYVPRTDTYSKTATGLVREGILELGRRAQEDLLSRLPAYYNHDVMIFAVRGFRDYDYKRREILHALEVMPS